MARGGNDLGRQVQAAELIGHPLGRPVHVVAVFRVGADAGNPQKLAQFSSNREIFESMYWSILGMVGDFRIIGPTIG